jgi:hypothetical protein
LGFWFLVWWGCVIHFASNKEKFNPHDLNIFQYKSRKQKLNLSGSQDKPTLTRTVPRSICNCSLVIFNIMSRLMKCEMSRTYFFPLESWESYFVSLQVFKEDDPYLFRYYSFMLVSFSKFGCNMFVLLRIFDSVLIITIRTFSFQIIDFAELRRLMMIRT